MSYRNIGVRARITHPGVQENSPRRPGVPILRSAVPLYEVQHFAKDDAWVVGTMRRYLEGLAGNFAYDENEDAEERDSRTVFTSAKVRGSWRRVDSTSLSRYPRCFDSSLPKRVKWVLTIHVLSRAFGDRIWLFRRYGRPRSEDAVLLYLSVSTSKCISPLKGACSRSV